MKAVIITTPLGNGHNAVAHALEGYLKKHRVQVTVLDLYEYIQPKLKSIVSKGYYFYMESAALVKNLASDFYDLGDKRDATKKYTFAAITNQLLASELNKFLAAEQPDAIICTQVYAAQVINVLKGKGAVTALAVGIITDFTVQNMWADTQFLDYIVTGDPRLAYQLDYRRISPGRVLPFGIPIDEKFSRKLDRRSARNKLGLDPTLPTLLVMSGGMGFGNMVKYCKEICKSDFPLQVIVVCGSNKKLYDKLVQFKAPGKTFRVLGYVDYVHLLMDGADCLLSKPGGVTTSEALAKELPMIMIDPLPGVEDRNVEFLLNCGAALNISKTFSIRQALHLYFDCPDTQTHLRNGVRLLSKPDSTKKLGDFLMDQCGQRKKRTILPSPLPQLEPAVRD